MPSHQHPPWVQGARYGVLSEEGLLFKPPAFGGRKSCDCVEKALYNTDVPEYPAHEFICLRHCVKAYVTQSHSSIRAKEVRTQSAIKARAMNRFAFGSEMLITECSIMHETSEEGKYAFLKDGDIVAEDVSYRSTNVSCVYKVPMGYSPLAFLEDVTANDGLAQTYFPGPMELISFPDEDTVQPASRHLAPESDVRNNQLLLDATNAATERYNQMQLDKRNNGGNSVPARRPKKRTKKARACRSRTLPALAGAGRAFTAPSTVAGPSSESVPAVGAVPSVPVAAPLVANVAPPVAATSPAMTQEMETPFDMITDPADPRYSQPTQFVSQGLAVEQPTSAFTQHQVATDMDTVDWQPAQYETAGQVAGATEIEYSEAVHLASLALHSVMGVVPSSYQLDGLSLLSDELAGLLLSPYLSQPVPEPLQSTAADYSMSMYGPLPDVQGGLHAYPPLDPSEPALDLQQHPSEPALDVQQQPVADDDMDMDISMTDALNIELDMNTLIDPTLLEDPAAPQSEF